MKKQGADGPNPSSHKASHLTPDAQQPEGQPGALGVPCSHPGWLLATKGPCVWDAGEGSLHLVYGCTRPRTFFQLDAFVCNLIVYVYFDFGIPGILRKTASSYPGKEKNAHFVTLPRSNVLRVQVKWAVLMHRNLSHGNHKGELSMDMRDCIFWDTRAEEENGKLR